ncbi:MAG: hypothetical protein KCHDKBKB_03091 [Elusimicrobia bacterium]|nr:hypothetical protein [Elusimicrobiota bacterium]
MLRALKKQLIQLAEDPKDQFINKVRERLNSGAESKEPAELRNFVLLLPDMIAQIRIWADNSQVPVEVKRLHGFVLTYLYHPVDLLPDEPYGFFGYLDDAYLVGVVYHRTMAHVYDEKSSNSDFSSKINGWLHLTRKVLPKETSLIDGLLAELVNGNDDAFKDFMTELELKKG